MQKNLLLAFLCLANGLFAQKPAETVVAKIDLSDPTQLVDNQLSVSISAKTYCGQTPMEEVTFWVSGQAAQQVPFSFFQLSNAWGRSTFDNLIPMAASGQIGAQGNGFDWNGVDQADFFILAAHLDGTQLFTEPWQWVAADVNADGQVTFADDTLLRQLILGIYSELPSQSSWRFIPAGYVFASPNPLVQAIPNGLDFIALTSDVDTTFLGIKIGDLNCSATPFTPSEGMERSRKTAGLSRVISPPFPNPTLAGASIQVVLDSAEELVFELFDFSGKLLFVNRLQAMPGENVITIPAQALPSAGLYTWQIHTGNWSQSGRLMRG